MSEKDSSAANHTYDIGYKKWESLDVDALLKDDEHIQDITEDILSENQPSESINLTPASIIKDFHVTKVIAKVPQSRGIMNDKDTEIMERELGNNEFQHGNFQLAVKAYTKCLGLKAANYIAFSNRAMAYLKLKEYTKAEVC